ncbi:MAG: universal stress protein [Gallicola sp.]|nr:universal stress protein [Gallicola sp.]
MKKLLVATDGSKIAGKAVEQAKELQRCFKSNVLLYTNLEDGGNYMPDDVRIKREEEPEKEESEVLLEDNRHWLKKLADSFPYPEKVTTMVDVGDVSARIVEQALREEADCIIMGSRGYGSMKSVFLGSSSKYVSQHARCSVFIVK